MNIPTQGTLPFLRKSRGRRVVVPEKAVEAEADFELSRFGFSFLNTQVRYPYFTVQCPNCRQFHKTRNTKGTGQDKGIADRLVYSPRWWHPLLKATLWLSVELKGSKTPFSSEEQRLLHEAGHTVLARDGETALEGARSVDRFFDYVDRLEQGAAKLLDALRSKSSDWKVAAHDLAQTLREPGEGEVRLALGL